MSELSRREILRLAAALGISPALLGLLGCDDSDDVDAPPDGGGMGGMGGGGDLGPEADMGPEPDMGPPDDGFPRYTYDGEPGPETLFTHGVASGDPLTDRVILWSHVEGVTEPTEVFWEISEDRDFAVRRNVGTFTTNAGRDFTVKVDALELSPGTTYFYRFHALGRTSPVGRTRTAPEGAVDRLRFAVVSCSSYAHGWFHTYRELATQPDLDAVLHLGDYIYEYGDGQYGNVRAYDPPHEIITLEDYRRRYRHYRKDAWLQAVHVQHPFICIWDDHESANDSWRGGAQNHDAGEGPWMERRAAAEQAYLEWIPIRESADGRIWRTLKYGELVDLVMLDSRLWGRDEQTTRDNYADPDRTLLGLDQEAWLNDELADSQAKWRLLGQQVMMGHLRFQASPNLPLNPVNGDQWDGYDASRQRLFQMVRDNEVQNLVVLTGDIHTSWAMELTEDPNDPQMYDPMTGDGALAVEFVATSVTSPGLPAVQPALIDLVLQSNPHIKWTDVEKKGWVLLDITAERVQGAWYHFDRIDVEEPQVPFVAKVFEVYDGAPRLFEVEAVADARADAPPLA